MKTYIFANLREFAIPPGFRFLFLMLLPLYGIVDPIFILYIFSQILQKHELRENLWKFLRSQ